MHQNANGGYLWGIVTVIFLFCVYVFLVVFSEHVILLKLERKQTNKQKNNYMIQQFYFWVLEGNKNTTSKRYMHPQVHCSIIYNSQDMDAT